MCGTKSVGSVAIRKTTMATRRTRLDLGVICFVAIKNSKSVSTSSDDSNHSAGSTIL
jgi:hypothetical protein